MMITTLYTFANHAHVAHCPDQLAHDYGISPRDMTGMGMNDFVRIAISVPYGNPASGAFSSVGYNPIYRGPQRRMLKIDSCLPVGPDIVVCIDTAVR